MDDPLQERLYEWERSFIETKVPQQIMSRDQIVGLVGRATALLELRQPKVRFVSLNVSCRATPALNLLEIADWGRNPHVLLHETAHLATWGAVLAGDAPHGLAFTTIAIILYNRFLGLSLDYLLETAGSRGLSFHEPAARSRLPVEDQVQFGDIDL